MNFCPIKKVTMTCPMCNSGIKVEINPEDDTKMQELLNASETFACPICKEKFGGAHKLLEMVDTYNKSAIILGRYNGLFNVEFEQ